MASVVFGAVGGVIGKQTIGGAIGASLGRAVFSGVGSMVDNALFSQDREISSEGRRITEVNFQHSSYGQMIPIIYGTMKVAGNIIWASPLQELAKTTTQAMGGKGGKVRHSHTGYDYIISLAIALCEGPISKVGKIWADGRLLDRSLYDIRIYKGCQQQPPDPTIEGYMGIGKAPAYRGVAYVFFRSLHLMEFGNRIPDFAFEVTRGGQAYGDGSTPEAMINAVTLLPGAGEFVYDTEVQQKLEGDYMGDNFIQRGYRQYINNHNIYNKANISVALDDMQQSLPNVKWVAPVVSWFATSEDLSDCIVVPGVEGHDIIHIIPSEWRVGGRGRYDAHCIGRNDGKPRYGGTPCDSSIINMLQDLRKRELKVMLYPMLFIDLAHKPWRGRITGMPGMVQEFFTKKDGYNQFILHYAHLAKGLVDAFVIGSELIGLTKVMAGDKSFPAVEELIKLAREVKCVLGPEVKVTYAADWSEYHHTDGGWYNLDPLWACEAIDVVGIDAYFPLTEGRSHGDLLEEAKAGWDRGECYDYYYEDEARSKRVPLSPAYAIKNITWWWENNHYNPDGQQSMWRPGSKKIWFTEYGFPSVDGATNQPNVFYNPESSESALPRDSNHEVSFAAQRAGIAATELRWRGSHVVENKFVWTWDARPYPEWPDYTDVWADGACWQKGHWLQGKLGVSEIGQVVGDLCERAGLAPSRYHAGDLSGTVHGIMLNRQNSSRDILSWLQSAFAFEIVEREGVIHFNNRSYRPKAEIGKEQLLSSDSRDPLVVQRPQTSMLPSEISINYIDQHRNYQVGNVRAKRGGPKQRRRIRIDLPMLLEAQQAQAMAENMLQSAWLDGHTYSFFLPVQYYHLCPGDVVPIIRGGGRDMVKITRMIFGKNKAIYLEAVRYCRPLAVARGEVIKPEARGVRLVHIVPQTKLEVLDIRLLPHEDPRQGRLLLAAVGLSSGWKGAVVFANLYGQRKMVASVDMPATMGVCITSLSATKGNLLDRKSRVVVNLIEGRLTSATEKEFEEGENLALIDNEIVQFKRAVLLHSNQYELSHLVRGKFGSQEASAAPGQRFVLLDQAVNSVVVPDGLIGGNLELSYISNGRNIDTTSSVDVPYKAECLRPLAPVHIRWNIKGDLLVVKWCRRSRAAHSWLYGGDVPLMEESERYLLELYRGKELLLQRECDKSMAEIELNLIYCVPDKIRIYQLSAVVGFGEVGEINMP